MTISTSAGRNEFALSGRAAFEIAGRAARATREWIERMVRRSKEKQALMELLEKPDHVLEDIGFPRYEILAALDKRRPLRSSGL
jgi:uncharacterized protein YjiS (DUF1127 family)